VSTALGPVRSGRRATTKRGVWVAAACFVYLLLTCYQLGLPGLHYDEAKEAGVNAMELLTGSPTTPFRNVALTLFGQRLPLMVQDYIGALNVYLVLPVLALTGVGVPNLRIVAVLIGLATLLLVAYTVSAWQNWTFGPSNQALGGRLTWGGVLAAWLLAASPSFIFWSRQGIFVTNLMQPLCFLAIWQGTRWLATGERRSLLWMMFAAGLALYAKLMALWVIGPWLLLVAAQWWLARRRVEVPRLDLTTLLWALVAFVLPLLPLLWFNMQTGGTFTALWGNAAQSYYGVDNLALWDNAGVRLQQLIQSLRGDHFWYLGGLYNNPVAPWFALVGIAAGLAAIWQRMVVPLLLLLLAMMASCFTISNLFITHYALILPIILAVVALGMGLAWERWAATRWWLGLLVAGWMLLDLRASLLYHQTLARSGGLADHSDASYHLAYHLRYNGLGAPVALDWGLDAPIRYLSVNTVRPIEIFGYGSPAAPDENFTLRLLSFLDNPDNVYLLHAPGQTAFAGRREAFLATVAKEGKTATLEQVFAQRDGTPLYELWRVGEE
jgi:hypothetical protein